MKKKKKAALPDADGIIGIFKTHDRPLRTDAILAIAHSSAKAELSRILRSLAAEGRIARLPGGFWGLAQKSICVTGEFNGLASGGGKVRVTDPPDYPHPEIFISPFQKDGAWHKDIVRVLVLPHSGGSKGRVLKVVERVQREIPAILELRQKKYLRFRPADGRLSVPFLVPVKSRFADAIQRGWLAILQPEKELADNEWQASILRVLGEADRVAAQESIVKLSQQVPGEFPRLAIAQAEAVAPPAERDIEGREDWRSLPFVTVDGADARDFDDAIHVETTEDGWILRVAIADVSHYVRPDDTAGSLDREALARGNSWYFPRSVEPMLPQALSNGICSLKPDEDRLAMMVEMRFNRNLDPLPPRFAPIVMRSQGRLIYDDVAKFFAGEKSAIPNSDLWAMLEAAFGLYQGLSAKRRERGTLDFFLPEPTYEFDGNGRLVKMGEAQRNDAHKLIEEFMIAANEAVATWLGTKGGDFLYRVHPRPEQEKLARLYETLKSTALERLPSDLWLDGAPNAAALRQILANAAGTPEEYVVNRLCLRSMAQARYQPENIGHFGLASSAYCHFTSPIRRYADLLTHRSLKTALGDKTQPVPARQQLAEIGDQLNALERRAVECEREMAKRLACIFLENRTGEVFYGTISGVAEFGLFVEFAGICAEGLIRTDDLGNDWYQVDQPTQSLTGMRSGQIWRLGQPVKVRLLSVDLEKQEIRLAPAEKTTLKRPAKNRSQIRIKGKERRSEHRKPAKSSRWLKEDSPGRSRRRKR